MKMYKFISAIVGLLVSVVNLAFKATGLKVNAGRVSANLVTDRIVIRNRAGKLVGLLGVSRGAGIPVKVFFRSDFRGGIRLSAGGIRKPVQGVLFAR